MIIKRPVYNEKLKCVALEVIAKEAMANQQKQQQALFDLIQAADTNNPLLVPYVFKSLLEEKHDIPNPIIFKIHANDIENSISLDELKQSPHSIALLVDSPDQLAWLNFAEYIAISEFLMNQADISKVVQYSQSQQRKVIGYGLIQPQSFERCKSLTMDFFCGDFLLQPNEIGKDEQAANKLTVLELISILQQPDADLNMVTKLINSDPLLSFQVLRIANSVAFSGVQSIASIDEAVLRLGLKHLKNWVMVLSMSNISSKPLEVVESGLIRATMAETIAKQSNQINTHSAYTAGLLSVLDSLLDMPIEKIIDKVSLAAEIRIAILEQTGNLGELLASVVAYEEGRWDALNSDQIFDMDLSEVYITALESVSKDKQALRNSVKRS